MVHCPSWFSTTTLLLLASTGATQGLKLVWSEEFNGATLNTANWNIETGTGVNGDFGTGQLDRATDRSENLRIVQGVAGANGGVLSITTRKERYIDRDYTSGRINTEGKVGIRPGHKLEARIWARDVKYQGQGFAFWLMPNELPPGEDHLMWPQGGEMDIMEYVGSIPNYNLATVHYAWYWMNNTYVDWNHGHLGGYYSFDQQQGPSGEDPGYGDYPPSPTDPNTGSYGWHTYSINWHVDRIEFMVDDHVYHVHYLNDGAAYPPADGQDRGERQVVNGKRVYVSEYTNHFDEWHPFEHEMYVILSAGVGGSVYTYGGPIVPEAQFPVATFVDWVRVYELEDGGSPPAPTPSPTSSTPATCASLESGVDYIGNDVGATAGPASPAECCSACGQFPTAKAFTWAPNICYCKSGKGATSADTGVTSGTIGATTVMPTSAPTSATPGTCRELVANVNLIGNDVGTAVGSEPQVCCSTCAMIASAKAFTWQGGVCYCKSGKGGTNVQVGVTSGVFA